MSYQTATAVLAGIGGLLLIVGLAFFARPRWFLGWLKGMMVVLLLAAGAYAVVIAIGLSHYQSLSGMQTIATVEVQRLAPQQWNVTLRREGEPPGVYSIRGDQWQVDARIIRFGGPLGWLQVAPGYRLERLSGRYLSLEQERFDSRSVVGLAGDRWPDLWELDQAFNLPFVEGVYGNATFMPMRNGAEFQVKLSASGLVAVPTNEAAREAVRLWSE